MKSLDIESRFNDALKPIIVAANAHAQITDKLCRKIELSNGQIYRALSGVCSYEVKK